MMHGFWTCADDGRRRNIIDFLFQRDSYLTVHIFLARSIPCPLFFRTPLYNSKESHCCCCRFSDLQRPPFFACTHVRENKQNNAAAAAASSSYTKLTQTMAAAIVDAILCDIDSQIINRHQKRFFFQFNRFQLLACGCVSAISSTPLPQLSRGGEKFFY
jgi:hypothetical protein